MQTFPFGEFIITTDKPYYNPGDELSGSILLNVLHPTHLRCLKLRMKGKEKACVKASDKEESEPLCEKKKVFQMAVRLSNEERVYEKGLYKFPFKLMLPAGIPGNVVLESENKWGLISYSLKAEIQPSFDLNNSGKHSMSCDKNIFVYEPLITPPQALDRYRHASLSCCCFSRGFVSLSLDADKYTYVPGEMMRCQIAIDNRGSSVAMNKDITLELISKLVVCAQGIAFHKTWPIADTKMGIDVAAGTNQKFQIDLQIPIDAAASSSGNLIKTSYELRCVMRVPRHRDILIVIPIQLYFVAPAWTPEPSLTENGSAVVQPESVLTVARPSASKTSLSTIHSFQSD